VSPSTTFSYRGKKRKSYKHKLTPTQQAYVLREAAVRDYIKTERQKGRSVTYKAAQTDEKFVNAIATLETYNKLQRKTVKAKREATSALKVLGRLSKYFKGIYF
jgi:hypothetical protein